MIDWLLWAAGKIVAPLAMPRTVIALWLLLAAFLILLPGARPAVTRLHRWGRRLLGGLMAALLLLCLINPGHLLIHALETHYAVPPAFDRAAALDPAGIVGLSGAVEIDLTESVGHLQVNRSADRILTFAGLVAALPGVPAVYSGGAGGLGDGDLPGEAALIRPLMARFGLTDGSVRFEADSRSTWENATRTAALLRAEGLAPEDGPWILVTSARHMPRAIGAFAAAGYAPLVPWPTDYTIDPTDGPWQPTRNVFDAIAALDGALYELYGTLWYRLTGRMAAPQTVALD